MAARMRTQASRLKQAEGRTGGKKCACQSAFGILRGYLSYPTMEAALSAPRCDRCGRLPYESADGYAVKLDVGLDAEEV